MLMIDSDTPDMPSQDLAEKENILAQLYGQNLIGYYRLHSAYEKVGIDFLEEKFEPALDTLFRNF
jgi:hypothetical protein